MMKEKRHTFHGLFIFLLLGVFAVMSTLLVLYSAQVYNRTVARSEGNNADRIIRSFMSSIARTGDEEGALYVGKCTDRERPIDYIERYDYFMDGFDGDEGGWFVTRLYCDNGKLWEVFAPIDEEQKGKPVDYQTLTGENVSRTGTEESSGKGYEPVALCDAIAFKAELNEKGLLQASLADTGGVYKVKIALRTAYVSNEGGDGR